MYVGLKTAKKEELKASLILVKVQTVSKIF